MKALLLKDIISLYQVKLRKKKLKNDWKLVQKFVKEIHQQFISNPESQCPRLSTDLKHQLMLIDSSPKYSNPPRFRLKRSVVNTLIQKSLGKKYKVLPKNYNSFEQFDYKLKELTELYHGKTAKELLTHFYITYKLNKYNDVGKSIGEKIISHMFGIRTDKMSKINLFSEVGTIGKTISLSSKDGSTEDTKFSLIDFTEISEKYTVFEESQFFDAFIQKQFLFIVFKEETHSKKLLDNIFVGFKRFTFSDEFNLTEVKKLGKTFDTLYIIIN